jgi:hypothetical protein
MGDRTGIAGQTACPHVALGGSGVHPVGVQINENLSGQYVPSAQSSFVLHPFSTQL